MVYSSFITVLDDAAFVMGIREISKQMAEAVGALRGGRSGYERRARKKGELTLFHSLILYRHSAGRVGIFGLVLVDKNPSYWCVPISPFKTKRPRDIESILVKFCMIHNLENVVC